jgi:hypothetical protein
MKLNLCSSKSDDTTAVQKTVIDKSQGYTQIHKHRERHDVYTLESVPEKKQGGEMYGDGD